MQARLATATSQGLHYLAARQEPDGSFMSYLDVDPSVTKTNRPIKTVFIPALILTSLSHINTLESLDIRNNLAQFLLSQKSEQWTFNFLSDDDPQRYGRNYPDDLDDTFCAYIALHAHDSQLITTDVLVQMTKVLLAAETTVGGPYRTWLAPLSSQKIWLDVDPAVNSNVLYFLTRVTTPPEGLITYIETCIKENNLLSPYYVPIYPILYYLSRSYSGPQTQTLRELLESKNTQASLSALECALTVSTLLRLTKSTVSCTPFVEQLLGSQGADGSWPSAGFCTDEKRSEGLYHNGCAALTTAFTLEAFSLYQHYAEKEQPTVDIKKETSRINTILHTMEQDTSAIEKPLHNTVHEALTKTLRSQNAKEITQFAYNFNQSLRRPLSSSTQFLNDLGLANLYGWTAYTIYDDFLDYEGQPVSLPAANTLLRLSFEKFLRASPNPEFQTHVRTQFNIIDNANTWELANCRFDTYKQRSITIKTLPEYDDLMPLAHRSIGHTLSPLAVVYKRGYALDSSEFQAIYTALKHYIIAKQLNDDAHDWQEDFLFGRITFVVATLLQELAVTPGTYQFHNLLPTMQRHFWHHTLTTICNKMQYQLHLSRQALSTSSILKDSNILIALLDSIDTSIQDTLTKQSKTKEFLQHF